jgi:hypothetical protein
MVSYFSVFMESEGCCVLFIHATDIQKKVYAKH